MDANIFVKFGKGNWLELEKGYVDMVVGRIKPAKQAFVDIRRDYGI